MKNIIKISSLILAFVIIGCDAVDDSRFQQNRTSGWVEFVGDSADLLSTDGSVTIETEYNVPINREGVTITYDVQVIEGEVPGFETGTFTTTVPPDTVDAPNIVFDIDPTIEGNYTVQYTILSTSNPDVIVGLDGADNPIVYTFEVCNNDFPLNWTGTTYQDGDFEDPIGTFDMVLTPTEEPGVYTIDNAWGNFVFDLLGIFDGGFVYQATFTRNADNSIVIFNAPPEDEEAPYRYPGTVAQDDAPNGNLFDPCTKEMFYTLDQGVFTAPFTVDVVLTPTVSE